MVKLSQSTGQSIRDEISGFTLLKVALKWPAWGFATARWADDADDADDDEALF